MSESYMLKEIRRDKIQSLLRGRKSITTAELSELLGVTPETVRKDIQFLEDNGALKRIFGGVMSVGANVEATGSFDPSFRERSLQNNEAKQKMARFAATLLQKNDTIALDSSTTTFHMIKFLPEDANLTVVSNSFAVITELNKKEGISIIGVGGYLRKNSTSFLGNIANRSLEHININKAFMSGQAVSPARGLMDPVEAEAYFKSHLAKASDTVILLADSSKFNKSAPITSCKMSTFSTVISDAGLAPEIRREIEKLNIELHLV